MRIRFAAALVILTMLSISAFARSTDEDSLLIKKAESSAKVEWYDRI